VTPIGIIGSEHQRQRQDIEEEEVAAKLEDLLLETLQFGLSVTDSEAEQMLVSLPEF